MSKSPTSPTSPVAEAASPKATSPVRSPTLSSADATSPTTATPKDVPAPTAVSPTIPENATAATENTLAAPGGNAKVEELSGMFPTVDKTVIEMVLEEVGGSQDRAIENLLQMTDPEFKPMAAPETTEASSQLDLDHEFAKALQLQDEEDRQAERAARHASRRTAQERQNVIPDQLPYQPRIRKPRAPGPDPYAASTRQNQLQSQYGNSEEGPVGQGLIGFAEASKSTFSSIFNRAKTKYNDYQAHQQQRAHHDEDGWGNPPGQVGHNDQQGRAGGLWGQQQDDAVTLPSPATLSSSLSSMSTEGGMAQRRTSGHRWNPSDSWDDTPTKPTGNTIQVGGAKAVDNGTAQAQGGAQGNKMDLSKLGFLPKKRVDLLSGGGAAAGAADRDPNPQLPTSPTTPTATGKSMIDKLPKTPPAETNHHTLGDSDDDDDLEYTKNPFDEK